MPKMKTNSSCKKRFKKNGSGKVKRSKAFKRHHAWAKTSKQKRSLRKGSYFTGENSKSIAAMLPY